MQVQKINMKQIMDLLLKLKVNSLSGLLKHLGSIYKFEDKEFSSLTNSEKALYPNNKEGDIISVCVEINDLKAFEFVNVCNDVLGEKIEIETTTQLYELLTKYSELIYSFETIAPASNPNEPPTN